MNLLIFNKKCLYSLIFNNYRKINKIFLLLPLKVYNCKCNKQFAIANYCYFNLLIIFPPYHTEAARTLVCAVSFLLRSRKSCGSATFRKNDEEVILGIETFDLVKGSLYPLYLFYNMGAEADNIEYKLFDDTEGVYIRTKIL